MAVAENQTCFSLYEWKVFGGGRVEGGEGVLRLRKDHRGGYKSSGRVN